MWTMFGPFCPISAILSPIDAHVGVLFTGLNNAMAYQKWQLLRIWVPSYIVDRFKKLLTLYVENYERGFCTYKKHFYHHIPILYSRWTPIMIIIVIND